MEHSFCLSSDFLSFRSETARTISTDSFCHTQPCQFLSAGCLNQGMITFTNNVSSVTPLSSATSRQHLKILYSCSGARPATIKHAVSYSIFLDESLTR